MHMLVHVCVIEAVMTLYPAYSYSIPAITLIISMQ